ncbi:MAG: aminotransferase class IV [Myxococcota bacterium]
MNYDNEASEHLLRRLGSYTTARVSRGRVERTERHALRLARDARRLGLPAPKLSLIESLFRETAEREFPDADGIVRVEWSRLGEQAPELIARHRSLGDSPPCWRACSAVTLHPGPEALRNTKAVTVPAYDSSREEMKRFGVEEVLLFDAAGILVEGCRSNLLLVLEDDAFVTPDLSLGPVEGIGLQIVAESRSDLNFARVQRDAVKSAKEIMAVNAVRGVVPVTELDQKPVGSGQAGPVAKSLASLFG